MPQDEQSAAAQRPGFSEALRFWFKLGWISFGGTAAHIAIMHDELVQKKALDQQRQLPPCAESLHDPAIRYLLGL